VFPSNDEQHLHTVTENESENDDPDQS
jgi:hypothetical protein